MSLLAFVMPDMFVGQSEHLKKVFTTITVSPATYIVILAFVAACSETVNVTLSRLCGCQLLVHANECIVHGPFSL